MEKDRVEAERGCPKGIDMHARWKPDRELVPVDDSSAVGSSYPHYQLEGVWEQRKE